MTLGRSVPNPISMHPHQTHRQLEDQDVNRGSLQQLRSESQMWSGMVAVLCSHLKWETLARLIRGLAVRIPRVATRPGEKA